jgi:hypothetical protein
MLRESGNNEGVFVGSSGKGGNEFLKNTRMQMIGNGGETVIPKTRTDDKFAGILKLKISETMIIIIDVR